MLLLGSKNQNPDPKRFPKHEISNKDSCGAKRIMKMHLEGVGKDDPPR